MDSNLVIRQMNLDDLRKVIAWANEEDWVFSESDAEPYLNIDPNGFFIGEINDEVFGSIAAVKYGDYAFIDLYLVRKQFRGKGYGTKLLEHALDYCKDCKILGLDALEETMKHWQKIGFKDYYKILAFEKIAEGVNHPDLVDLKTISIEKLVEYDTDAFGYPRRNFLEALLKQAGYIGIGDFEDNKLVGYGVLRKTDENDAYVIGPLCANSPEIAKKILEGLQNHINGKHIYSSLFSCNQDAIKIINEQEGWSPVSNEIRLYKGGEPKTDMKRIYVPVEEFS